jgi:predicted membrane protein
MKNTIIKFGLYGLLTAVILFFLALVFGKGLSYSTQEIIGYITMIASLSFVFFGIKHYRDQVNNGIVSFGNALLIGVLISAIVGIGIGIADYIYTTVINPDFAQEFLETSIKNLETMYSGAELEAKKNELTQQMTAYGGSGFLAFIMFVTVLMIGFILSLISGLILQRKSN